MEDDSKLLNVYTGFWPMMIGWWAANRSPPYSPQPSEETAGGSTMVRQLLLISSCFFGEWRCIRSGWHAVKTLNIMYVLCAPQMEPRATRPPLCNVYVSAIARHIRQPSILSSKHRHFQHFSYMKIIAGETEISA